jgi:hypothetical protein
MLFEQSIFIPYLVGSVLALGLVVGDLKNRLPMGTGDLITIMAISFIGSWLYVGVFISTKLSDIIDKLK